MNIPENYLPIIIQFAVGFGFVILCILGTHFLGPRQKSTSVKKNESLMNDLDELKGKTLGCWCCPERCHGDILIDLLNKKLN